MRASSPIQEDTPEPQQTLLEDPVSAAPTTEVLLQYYAEQFVEAEELIAFSFEKPEVLVSYGLNAELLRSEALQMAEGVLAQAKESADPEVARRLGYYQILKNRLENSLEEDRIAKIADEEGRQKAFVQLQGKRSDDIQLLKGMHAAGLPEATELLILETQLKALDVWVSYEDERKELTPEKQAVLQKVAELVVTGKAWTLATAVELLQQNPEGLSAESQAYLREIPDEKLIGKLLGYTREFPYAGDFVEAGYHSPAHVALLLQTEGGYGRTAYEMYQLIQRMDVQGKATDLVTSNVVALEGRGTFASGFKRGAYHVIRSTSLPEVALCQVLPLTLALRLAGKAQLGALAALGARGISGRKAIALGWTTRFAVAGGAMFGVHTGADVGKALIAGKEVAEVLEPKHLGWNLLSSILSIAGIEVMGKLGTALGLKVAPKLKMTTVQNGQWALTGGGTALTKGMHHLFAYSGMTGGAWLMQGGIDGETAGRSLVDYWAFPAASKLNEVFFPAMTKGGVKQHVAIAKAEAGLLKQALMQAIKADAAPSRGALQGAAGMIGGLALLSPGMAEAMAKQPGGLDSVPWWAWLAAGAVALPFLGMAKVRKEDFIRPGNDRANDQAKWVADQVKARLWNDFGIERDPKVLEKKVEQEFIHYKKKGHQRHNDNVDPESFPEIVENLVSYFSGKAQVGGRPQASGTASGNLYVSVAQQGPSRAASKQIWAKLSGDQRGALEERVARELEVEGRKVFDMYGYESWETVEREMLFMVMEEVVARKEKLYESLLLDSSQKAESGHWKAAMGMLGLGAGLMGFLEPSRAQAAVKTGQLMTENGPWVTLAFGLLVAGGALLMAKWDSAKKAEKLAKAADPQTSPKDLVELWEEKFDSERKFNIEPGSSLPREFIDYTEGEGGEIRGYRQELEGVLIKNPNLPFPLMAKLGLFHLEAFLSNPAIPLLLLENPQLFGQLETHDARELAGKSATPSFVLESLATHPDSQVKRILAANPFLPETAARILANSQDPEVLGYLAGNQVLPRDLIETLANENFDLLAKDLAYNARLPFAIFERIFRRGDYKLTLAGNPGTPPEFLEVLSRDSDLFVRRELAENRAIPLEVLYALAFDPDWSVRSRVAKHAQATPELLAQLATDPHYNVRRAVAENENTPPEIKEAILGESSPEVIEEEVESEFDILFKASFED